MHETLKHVTIPNLNLCPVQDNGLLHPSPRTNVDSSSHVDVRTQLLRGGGGGTGVNMDN